MLFKKWALIVVTPNLLVGGAEKVAVSLANEAALVSGNKVLVLSLNGEGPLRAALDVGVTFIDLKSASSVFLLARLFAFLLCNQGPIISCQRTSNVYVGFCNFFLCRRRVLFREASTLTSLATNTRFKRFLKVFSMRLSYKNCNWVVANSEDTRKDLLKYSIAEIGKCKVIGNPVIPRNIKELRENNNDHKWLGGDFNVILSVGRLEAVKDHFSTISAMKHLVDIDDDYRLLIIGDGELRESLLDKVNELGIFAYVDLICFSENVFSYMSRADVFVSTSLWEGFGNTIVEAMGCDLPVIGFDCPGGARQLIADDPVSLLINNRSVIELAKGIDVIVKKNLPKSDSPIVVKYTIKTIFKKYYELLHSVS